MLEGDEPAAGKFLIASRGLLDPNFSQTVILLVEYGSEGAMGVIINRPTAVDLEELLPDLGGDEAPDVTVGVGGPVAHWQMVLLYRRSAGFEESESVFDDVYFSASRDVLDQLLAEGSEFRIYVGYAGWSPGQLDFEIDRGSWYVLPGDTDSIFGPAPFELWRELIVQGEAKWVLTPAPPSVPGARQDPALARVSPVDRRVPAVE
jgi:putative transcriptional regulator